MNLSKRVSKEHNKGIASRVWISHWASLKTSSVSGKKNEQDWLLWEELLLVVRMPIGEYESFIEGVEDTMEA